MMKLANFRGGAATLVLAALIAPAAAGAQSLSAPLSTPNADQLAADMRALAANPEDLRALISAGEASVRLGDPAAALQFFSRAERVDPRNPKARAGRAAALVALERPGEALRLFAEADGLGAAPADFAIDRGLANDLLGRNAHAQADYRLALARGANDEATRRLALSLALSGDSDEAETLLNPLLHRNDRAAWRTRAFVLALKGDYAGADRIAASMLPGFGPTLSPFFRRLGSMNAVDRAFAVHFGELGVSPTRLADASMAPAARGLPTSAPVRLARAEPDAPRSTARDDRARVTERSGRRARDRGVRTASAPAPTARDVARGTVTATPRRTARATAPAPTPAPAPVRMAAAPAPTPARVVPAPAPTPAPAPSSTIVLAAAPAPTTGSAGEPGGLIGARIARDADGGLRVAAAPASSPAPVAPAATPTTVVPAPAPVPAASVPAAAPTTVTAPPPSSPAPATVTPAPSPAPAPVALASTPTPAPGFTAAPTATAPAGLDPRVSAEEAGLADRLLREITVPASELGVGTPAPVAEPVEIVAAEPAPAPVAAPPPPPPPPPPARTERPAATRAAAAPARRPAPPAEPSRHWVQVAGGANRATLSREWDRVVAANPLLKGRQGWTTPLRATNRILTGPFKTSGEAQAFVNRLAGAGLSAFTFTSDAGQKITRLDP